MADPSVELAVVVAAGDRRASLTALRDHLAHAIDGCDSLRDLASLSARLMAVLAEIETIPSKAEVSPADEVSKRRAARRAGSKGSSRAKGAG